MQWTIEHHKHYSTEHLQKAEKYRLAQELEKNPTPPRKGILGRRRVTRHNI
jgi:hypothetical protein